VRESGPITAEHMENVHPNVRTVLPRRNPFKADDRIAFPPMVRTHFFDRIRCASIHAQVWCTLCVSSTALPVRFVDCPGEVWTG